MRAEIQNSSILRLLLILMAFIVIALGLRSLAVVAGPVLAALVLALACTPLYQWLQRKGLKPGLALLTLTLLVLAVFVGLGWLVLVSFQTLAQTLPTYTANMQAEVSEIAANLAALGVNEESATAAGSTAVAAITTIAAQVLSTGLNLVVNVLIILVLLVFLVAESPRYPARLRRGLGEKSEILAKVRAFRQSVLFYFVARIKVNLLTSTGVLVMLLITGIDSALLWAVLAFFLSFVPYFGIIIAMIPPVILGFAQYGSAMAVALIIGYTIINQVAEQILAPKIVGNQISLSPALTFMALFFWGWIFDFMGVLLAAPLTVMIVMLFDYFPDTRWLAALAVADKKEPAPVAEERDGE
jgi:predicted PurR-regulated permease PerM